MPHRVTVLPLQQNMEAADGENLLQALRRAGFAMDAPCGGNGSCGKCNVTANGTEVLACRTAIHGDMTVVLPATGYSSAPVIQSAAVSGTEIFCLAFDIGTTTVAGYLVDGKTGRELASGSLRNPQTAFGADVISRIQSALHGHMEELTAAIRNCVSGLARSLCEASGISCDAVTRVCIVGNPAMQQLFLGICPENLARIPFAPVLTRAQTQKAGNCLPCCADAELFIAPDISGYVGADTVACILATGMDQQEETALLVDIGTNGEMALGNRHQMVACSTAAGPALEGAGISMGMRGETGAIDHVWLENNQLRCSVIGGGTALGICGSGLIDAVAAALDLGWINARGKILTEDTLIRLTDTVSLTQEDIRQVQLAKGAIAAGIRLMAERMELPPEDISTVYLAGAFGSHLNPRSACRIGLLPRELEDKITAVGNAAGNGAVQLACHPDGAARTQAILDATESLELASLPEFSRCFAKNMRF